MAMKRRPDQRRRRKGDTARLAARLAPLEEQETRAAERQDGRGASKGASQENGAIIVDANNLNLPKGINDEREESGNNFFGIEPLVLFILGGMLLFILFIAWQISRMPPPG